MLMNQIIMEEDLPYEKELRILEEKKRKEMEEKKRKQTINLKLNRFKSKMSKAMIEKQKEEKFKELNQEIIVDDLSFMTDLSLSNVSQSCSQFRQINTKKDFNEEKSKTNLIDSTVSEEKNEIMVTKDKIILHDNDELKEKISFQRPKSILNSILRLKNDIELEKKHKKLRDKFNLNTFIAKENKKGIKMNNIKKRNSFLNFLKYTQEPENLEEYILNTSSKILM